MSMFLREREFGLRQIECRQACSVPNYAIQGVQTWLALYLLPVLT